MPSVDRILRPATHAALQPHNLKEDCDVLYGISNNLSVWLCSDGRRFTTGRIRLKVLLTL